MTTPGSPATAPELRKRITEVRHARMSAQKNAGRRGTIETALASTLQDRDSLTSPTVEQLRSHSQLLIARLLTAWGAVDSIRHLIARHDAAGVTTAGTERGRAVIEALAEETAQRDAARQALTRAGVTMQVPDPAPLSPSRAHPNRDKIVESLDAAADDVVAREAKAAQPTRRRPTNREVKPRGTRDPR